jgi:hypothetical protein
MLKCSIPMCVDMSGGGDVSSRGYIGTVASQNAGLAVDGHFAFGASSQSSGAAVVFQKLLPSWRALQAGTLAQPRSPGQLPLAISTEA